MTASPKTVLAMPARPKRAMVPASRRRASGSGKGVVLGAEREPGHGALERAERLQGAGEEAGVADLHLAEAGGALAARELGRGDQHRVLVEGTGGHDVAADRVPGVVLEDGERPAGGD